MAKIPLTIDPDYCADWGAWEGVRELISNAKDAEDEDPAHKMEVQHLPRTSRLVIRTSATSVDPSALLVLGKSSKRGHDVRGRFGEGFAIGCLALTRAGHEVTFVNGDSKWRCEIVHADDDHPLAGSQLLTFWSRSVNPSEDFEITVEGVTTAIWDAMRKLFLFITPPLASEKVTLPSGTMLLGEQYRGQVFSRGVFVRVFEDLKCGYDLKELALDRDRRMVDEWRLHDQLAELWNEALRMRPEEMARPVYELAKSEDAPEGRYLKWRTDDRLIKTMREQFEAEHGEDAVPVTTMAEAKEIQALGAKPTVVNNTLKELLSKAGVSAESSKAKLEGAVIRRISLDELSEAEIAALATVESMTTSYAIVEFRGDRVLAKPVDEDQLLGVDRRLLSRDRREILVQVVAGEARRLRVDQTRVLLDAMLAVLRSRSATTSDACCDECGNRLTDGHASVVNKDHAESCSLYPHDDGAEALPT